MKTALCLLALGLITNAVRADVNLSIAKDQAKRAANQTPAQPGNPGAPQSPPVDPVRAAAVKNIALLRADLVSISAATDATAAGDQRISLLNHLAAAAQGTKASTAHVRQLAADLISALAGQKKVSAQAQKLATTIHALFNGEHITATQQETLLTDLTKTLTEAGVSAEAITAIEDSLKAIAAETK